MWNWKRKQRYPDALRRVRLLDLERAVMETLARRNIDYCVAVARLEFQDDGKRAVLELRFFAEAPPP